MSKATENSEPIETVEAVEEFKIVPYVPIVAANPYTEKVAELAKAPGSAAVITVPTADAAKNATKFQKAANAAGHGARKRATVLNADGTTSITFTLGKLRGSVETATVADEATGESASD